LSTLRLRLFLASAFFAALLFIRLGIWQLDRRDERRARNAVVRARLDSAEVDVGELPAESSSRRFRRVRVRGIPDYDHELVLANREPKGSPGVELLTPVRFPGRDTAVIVNRGWVYSPDAATVDLDRWHDRDSVFIGYVDEMPRTGGGRLAGRPRVQIPLTLSAIAETLPYPVAPFYVVVVSDSTPAQDRPARVGFPALDEGPHLSYAIQWFAFALIALGGAAAVVVRSRRGVEDA
jgi:surfeit locus 1 family protein